MRSQLNACIAGLLVGELVLKGIAVSNKAPDGVILTREPPPTSAMLSTAARLVKFKGPKIGRILSHMDRGLHHHLGTGSWETALAGLVDGRILGQEGGTLRPHYSLLEWDTRDSAIARLRDAAAGSGPIDPRIGLLLSMIGPAHLLEQIAPDRDTRGHARQRIDHALDGTVFEPIGKVVRKLISENASAASVAAS
jgi:hypothetical protein